MLARPASGRRRPAADGARHAAPKAPTQVPGPSPLIERLQTSAGNRAVSDLIASGGGLEALAQAPDGNLATLQLLAAQREAGGKPNGKGSSGSGGKDKASLRKAWAEAGLVAGGPLFDLINDDLSVASLVDMALPELFKLAKEGAATGAEKAAEGGESKTEIEPVGLDTKEAGQVAGALGDWAQGAATKWLKGDDGKRFLAKAQAVVNEHPKAAYWIIVSTLAAAIAGAVTAYFTNTIDPPEIKKTFDIKGYKLSAGVDLGKFRERILQSAKLGLSGKAGPGTMGIEATAKGTTDKKSKEEGYDLGLTGSYAVGDEKKGASAKLSAGAAYSTLTDQTSGTLGAGFAYKPIKLDTTWTFRQDGSGVLDLSAVGKLSDKLTLSGGATIGAYGAAATETPLGYKLVLASKSGKESDKITLDVDAKTGAATLGTEQTRALWGGSFTSTTSQGPESQAAGASWTRNALKLDLKYTIDKAGKESLETGVSGKGDGVEAALATRFGLGTNELEKLTVHLGFTTPDQTLSFLHDLSVELSEGKVEAKATETIKVRLKQIAAEVQASVGEKPVKAGKADDAPTYQQATASLRAEVGWKLPSGLILGAGAAATYGSGQPGAAVPWQVGPVVSVSYEALPIRLVGGVNVPVGAGSEGLPPVFGLSISPNFEFGKEKKGRR